MGRQRIHGRIKRQVQEMFEEEKPFLQILPLKSFAYFSQETRTVQDDGTIQVHDCYYAALPARLHTKVIVRIYDYKIEVIDPQTLTVLRRHPKGTRKGMVMMEEKTGYSILPDRRVIYWLRPRRSVHLRKNCASDCLRVRAGRGIAACRALLHLSVSIVPPILSRLPGWLLNGGFLPPESSESWLRI